MRSNLQNYILLYFGQTKTKDRFLEMLDTIELPLNPLGKLIIYGELKQDLKAKMI